MAVSARVHEIEIVPADRGWILEKIANAIATEAAKSDRFRVTVTTQPSRAADLVFFLPESAWRDDLADSIRVTYFAHKEDHLGAAALFAEVARKSDYCVTSSEKYAEVLRRDGAREVFTIPLGVDTSAFVPKVRFGVVGRTYSTGRKGESLLARVLDLPFAEFVFTGDGWPLPPQYYAEQDLPGFYQSLDYLVVPSVIEGGPVPMLEALSSGCEVIAPSDIGMVESFPHIPFRRGDAEDLRRVISEQIGRRLALRAAVLPNDWTHFGQRHLKLFEELIERRSPQTGGRLCAPATAPPSRACRALLVTHGSEAAARGGPTTRVGNIVRELRERGRRVDSTDNVRLAAADRYDVVHVFNMWPPESALAALAAARRSGAKVVFSPIAMDLSNWPLFHPFMERLLRETSDRVEILEALKQIHAVAHSRSYADPRQGGSPIEGIAGLFELLRRCCDLADRVVFLSELERRFLVALGARVDHGVLIRNGIDVDRIAGGDRERFRMAQGLDRYVVCVGRYEYRKNQALAALALRDAGYQFVCIGAQGDPGYGDLVRKLGGRNVRLVERIEDRKMLASAYAGAAAFLLPSWTEGAPLAAIEAGIAGVPLVLSEMSSEREYFGDDAVYVHPADPAGMRKAVDFVVGRSERDVERGTRANRLAAGFSMARHADATWALYQEVTEAASRSAIIPPLVVDVSALLHFERMRQPLSGVPTVEKNVLAELASLSPTLRCIVYNNVKGRFVEIDRTALEHFDEGKFNTRYWFSADKPDVIDRTAILAAVAAGASAPVERRRQVSEAPGGRLRAHAIVAAKRVLRHAPNPIRTTAVAWLRHRWPGFDPYISPNRSDGDNRSSHAEASQPTPSLEAGAGAEPPEFAERIFEHLLGTVFVRETPRYNPIIPPGARVLSLGQSWLSNGELLAELRRLTETRALSLEPYVYDLTYHTGAPITGWVDNGERFQRLLALLACSSRVYTESRQVERELQKLRVSRGLQFSTRRTGLRGRSLPRSDPRAAPRYAPDSFVLVLGSFNKRKNHDFLVHVWRELYQTWIAPQGRAFKLVLVGEVQEERKYGDPDFCANLGRIGIDVHSMLPDAAVAHLLETCAFTAYPSLQEGWGLPVQESLSCGKICLASDTLPVAQEIVNPALIRISPIDFYGWYDALKTWLDNDALRRAFSERASEYVQPTWRSIAEAIYR